MTLRGEIGVVSTWQQFTDPSDEQQRTFCSSLTRLEEQVSANYSVNNSQVQVKFTELQL